MRFDIVNDTMDDFSTAELLVLGPAHTRMDHLAVAISSLGRPCRPLHSCFNVIFDYPNMTLIEPLYKGMLFSK